ncbi:phosphorylase b kinase regulatory subunit beta-like [Styela clava]
MEGETKHAYNAAKLQLEEHYITIKSLLLPYQSPTTGLFSCGKDAFVRDSVYCAVAIWSLGLAYRRIDDDEGRCYELEHCTVKCMRGILTCYMRQSFKVEKFKTEQTNANAIHCKFDAWTGDATQGEYPHLQQDVVALFILYLVQMTASGLQIVFNTDEVAFVQNLVYYLERSYRVPDFGMWGRGSKYNNGNPELHASAVGAAKAALESVNGFNLFGKQHGAPWSVIWVDMDAHNRNRTVVDSLLPKESISKNSDSAILPTTSFPFFALDDDDLCKLTKTKVKNRLEGRYGYKRFVGDGYMTEVEDQNRKYYRPAEIKLFNGIECEWPLFFIYSIIDGVFHNDSEQVREYQEKLKTTLWENDDGHLLVPRFYYVQKDDIQKERNKPGSCDRKCSFDLTKETYVFLWGQALYTISQLLVDGLISRQEIDPVKRFIPLKEQRGVNMRYSMFQGVACETTIQVVLIAESTKLQTELSTYGIITQTSNQVEPVQIWPSQELVKVYEHLGVLPNLGLSGRPKRPIGALGTSKVYRILGSTVVCYPLLFDISDFYIAFDTQILLDEIKHTMGFINSYWRLPGRPLFITLLREDVMKKERLGPILEMLSAFKRGEWQGVKIRVGKIQSFIGSTFFEHLEFVRYGTREIDSGFFKPFYGLDEEDDETNTLKRHGSSCTNLRQQIGSVEDEDIKMKTDGQKSSAEIVQVLRNYTSVEALSYLLGILMKREGPQFITHRGSCVDHINRVYRIAAHQKKWGIVRYSACLCKKIVDSLAPSITAILVRGREVTLGVFNHEEVVINNPIPPSEIQKILYTKCPQHNDYEACLQQELVLHVAAAMTDHPDLFEGMLQVRIGWLVHAMKLQLSNNQESDESSYEHIYSMSPSEIKTLMLDVLKVSQDSQCHLSWLRRRQINGALNKVPKGFYAKVWSILERSPEGLNINGNHLPYQPTISDMSPFEITWCKLVGEKFAGIREPVYRHIMVETLVLTGTILERNPELQFESCVCMDLVIKSAYELYKKDEPSDKSDSMDEFYNQDPSNLARHLCKSVMGSLLQNKITIELENSLCSVC